MQLVLQHYRKTSSIAMLHVLPPTKKTLQPYLFIVRQFRTWVVKSGTSLFNQFSSNVAKQVHVFCCPFYCSLNHRQTDVFFDHHALRRYCSRLSPGGKLKKFRVIGSSKQIARSKGKTSFHSTVNILITFNCKNAK